VAETASPILVYPNSSRNVLACSWDTPDGFFCHRQGLPGVYFRLRRKAAVERLLPANGRQYPYIRVWTARFVRTEGTFGEVLSDGDRFSKLRIAWGFDQAI